MGKKNSSNTVYASISRMSLLLPTHYMYLLYCSDVFPGIQTKVPPDKSSLHFLQERRNVLHQLTISLSLPTAYSMYC